jgi:thiol:disulfide interchange protein DsbC
VNVKTLFERSKKYFIAFALLSVVNSVFAAEDLQSVKAAVSAKFAELGRGGITIEDIKSTPLPNIYSAHFPDGQQIYVTGDGKHFFTGDLMTIQNKRIVNITEAEKSGLRVKELATLKPKDSIVFPASGAKKTTVYVFTDVDCGYCIKLHNQMAGYNKLGIEVRYLAFPRAGIGSESYRKIASAWCADNRQEALTKLKQRQPIPENVCEGNPVAAEYELGQKLGVNGTPAIITVDGRMIPGYMPPEELAKDLGIL